MAGEWRERLFGELTENFDSVRVACEGCGSARRTLPVLRSVRNRRLCR